MPAKPCAGLGLLERQAAEDAAKLEWLRTAAKDAFRQLDRGEGISFASMNEFDAYVEEIGAEVSANGAGYKIESRRTMLTRSRKSPLFLASQPFFSSDLPPARKALCMKAALLSSLPTINRRAFLACGTMAALGVLVPGPEATILRPDNWTLLGFFPADEEEPHSSAFLAEVESMIGTLHGYGLRVRCYPFPSAFGAFDALPMIQVWGVIPAALGAHLRAWYYNGHAYRLHRYVRRVHVLQASASLYGYTPTDIERVCETFG